MNDIFRQAFEKTAFKGVKVPKVKGPSFGRSLRGSATSKMPTGQKVKMPKMNTSSNAKKGYKPGSKAGIKTNMY